MGWIDKHNKHMVLIIIAHLENMLENEMLPCTIKVGYIKDTLFWPCGFKESEERKSKAVLQPKKKCK